MYFSAHVLTGAAAASLTGQPVTAFAAGLASHAVLDAVPHHDYTRAFWGWVDFFAGLVIVLLLYRWQADGLILWGALGAGLPDLEVALNHYRLLGPHPILFFPSHRFRFLHRQRQSFDGVLTQVLVLGASLLLLTWYGSGGRQTGGLL